MHLQQSFTVGAARAAALWPAVLCGYLSDRPAVLQVQRPIDFEQTTDIRFVAEEMAAGSLTRQLHHWQHRTCVRVSC